MCLANFKRSRVGLILAGLLSGALVSPAWSDTIVLANGDRLTGKVQSLDDETLVLQTDYAGELRIDWNQIAQLQTDDPMLLRLKNAPADYQARLAAVPQRERVATVESVSAEQPSGEVQLADIQRIVRPDPLQDRWRFEGGLDITLDATHASSKNQSWSAATQTTARRDWWRHGLNADYTRKTQDGVVGTYHYNAAYTADRFLSEKLFLRGRLRYGRDHVDNPSAQLVLAFGPGHQFWDNELGAFSVSALVTHTRYRYHYDTRDNFQSAGFGWSFMRYFNGKQWKVFSIGDVQRVLRSESDYSVETELGLRYRLTDWLSLYAKAAYNRIAIVGQTTTNERRYSLGLGMHW